jgi:hypothetical protein
VSEFKQKIELSDSIFRKFTFSPKDTIFTPTFEIPDTMGWKLGDEIEIRLKKKNVKKSSGDWKEMEKKQIKENRKWDKANK